MNALHLTPRANPPKPISDMTNRTAKHLPGLDGLRVVAVFLVVICHDGIVINAGRIGVSAFFVLSGFLITRILYAARTGTIGTYLRNFYGRRTLRIFPLYYAYLIAVVVALHFGLPSADARIRVPFVATYSYDFYIASDAKPDLSNLFGHFWSLAVEEQFYLLWPLLVYFCRAEWLRGVLVALVCLGPVVRAISMSWVPHAQYLPIAHVDAFAIGALSSLFPLGLGRKGLFIAAIALTTAVLFFNADSGATVGQIFSAHNGARVVGFSLLNLASVLLIECLVRQEVLPSFFDHPWLVYLGKISYGLYVFHLSLGSMLAHALPHRSVWLRLAIQLPLTAAVASLSYSWLESRFLKLKDRWFANTPKPVREPHADQAA